MNRKIAVWCITGIFLTGLGANGVTDADDGEERPTELMAKTTALYDNGGYRDWYYKPSTYSQLVTWYQMLESQYPDYIEIIQVNTLYGTGTVAGMYDLYYVRLTNESRGLHKPEVLFLGGPHGDETVGTIGNYWFTDWLMRHAFHPDYDNPDRAWLRWLLDNREIYLEVSHNPYGFDNGPQRYDAHGWDLNREADYDGPGSPTGGIWASVPGKTLVRFVNNHTVRVGCDFHGGARMLLYPWADTHTSVTGISPITGESYGHAPPDFYFFDASSLRLGDYMGDYGGDLDEDNIGTIYELIWYSVKGGISPWAYAADVIKNPVEDPYVNDEIFGNYPGTGIMWLSPEMSNTKNPAESTFGNDTVLGWGQEVRRFILHQTDLAQPYIWTLPGTTANNTTLLTGENATFSWQVNGCLVVDDTYVQWGTDPDPVNNFSFNTTHHDAHAGDYVGGTGWDNALNGVISGTSYTETIPLNTPGTYYFVVKAKVDQIYNGTLAPSEYGHNHTYLRLIKERVNDSYYEVVNGTDGLEIVQGQTWWYSPVIRVTVKSASISQDYDLRAGWNLITLPVESNHTAKSLLAAIPGCTLVYGYDAANATAHIVTAGSPPETDFPIENGVGYFVAVSANTSFSITGVPLENPTVHLYPGWNLLGWYREQNTTAKSILGNITDCAIVYYYDATTGTPIIVTPSSPPETDFPVTRGMGLFVAVTSESDWHGEG